MFTACCYRQGSLAHSADQQFVDVGQQPTQNTCLRVFHRQAEVHQMPALTLTDSGCLQLHRATSTRARGTCTAITSTDFMQATKPDPKALSSTGLTCQRPGHVPKLYASTPQPRVMKRKLSAGLGVWVWPRPYINNATRVRMTYKTYTFYSYHLMLSKHPCKIRIWASVLLPLPRRTSPSAIRSRATSIHGLPLPWTQ